MKIILAAVVIWVVYNIVRFSILLTRGREASASTSAFEQHIPSATKRILVAGDSTGFGIGTTKPEDSTAGRLGAMFPESDIHNVSVSGDRVEDTLAILRSLSPSTTYDLMLLQVGANDITHRTPINVLEAELRELLNLAKIHSKQVTILHSGDVGTAPIFPWPVSWYLGRQSRIVRDMYIRVTEEFDVSYVDLLGAGVDTVLLQDIKKYYSPDQFHPSGEGYGVWFQEIRKIITVPLTRTS